MNQLKNLEIGVSYEKCNIYILIQCTWGLPQTLLGFIVLLINIKNKHYFYHGAIITERNVPSSFLQVYLWECSSLQQLIR